MWPWTRSYQYRDARVAPGAAAVPLAERLGFFDGAH
jgi:hypothetical protein